jgi:hypothetical protein
LGKHKGKNARKGKVRPPQRQRQPVEEVTMMAATAARGGNTDSSRGREGRTGDGGVGVGTAGTVPSAPAFVDGVAGMSDEWRAFYRAVGQAVK